MIVLDASAVVEVVLGTPKGRIVAERIADPAEALHAPHLLDVEVAQALRRYVRNKELDAATAKLALEDARELDFDRHAHEPLLDRVWELRVTLTAYDAVYVALAETLNAVLLTCDGRLARAAGTTAHTELVGTSK